MDYMSLKPAQFEELCGLSNGYLSKQKKREADLGEGVFKKILDNSPYINPAWLLIGEGEMLKPDKKQLQRLDQNRKTRDALIEDQLVPLYDITATAGLKELFDDKKRTEVLDTIHIPNLPRCDGAITVAGDSMYPLLKSGDMVLYAETTVEHIFWGEMYLLGIRLDDFDEYITVKYVQRAEREDYIRLVSQNAHHDPKDIPIDAIKAIALVKASISINTIL